MTRQRTCRIWYLILGGFAAMALISGLIALQPYGTPLSQLVRGAAVLGYLAIFLAIISSNYMRQLVRFFGRPFVQTHHILSPKENRPLRHERRSSGWPIQPALGFLLAGSGHLPVGPSLERGLHR